jgi:membrane associated rhomboid family serine protease
MAGTRTIQFGLPDFTGATRRIILWNLAAFFALLLATSARLEGLISIFSHLALRPEMFLSGAIWQPLTYSLVHPDLKGTLFELISLWFLCGFLEGIHRDRWVMGLYITSVLSSAATAILIYLLGSIAGYPPPLVPIYGCMGGIFGTLVAIGVLHGDTEFLILFIFNMKARYLAIIYALISFAAIFGESRLYAFAELGGGLAALLYIRYTPTRGIGFIFSERFYGLRNQYYRWKRRRAASKFQVYMKKQGRTVRFDGQGRLLDDDDKIDQNDKKRWN